MLFTVAPKTASGERMISVETNGAMTLSRQQALVPGRPRSIPLGP